MGIIRWTAKQVRLWAPAARMAAIIYGLALGPVAIAAVVASLY